MHIGLIAPPWLPVPPTGYGGTEAVVDRLARGLQRAGHQVLLFATGDSTAPVPRAAFFDRAQPELVGTTVVELAHAAAAYDELAAMDVIHDHTVAGALVAPRRRTPVVVTHHGVFDAVHRQIFQVISERASVVAISRAQAAGAVPGTIRRVIHHGIDVETVPFGAGTGGYLAFVGRMSPTKGPHVAIELARRAGVPLKIAAKCREPGEQEFFAQVIRPRLGGDIEYLGEITRSERQVLLAEAQALLNPIQWSEPFGLVMIEALAAGTPVLARKLGAAPEIVDHGTTGCLADTDEGVLDAIDQLDLFDRRACRAAAEQRFSTDRMVRDHLALFDDLLSRPLEHRVRPAPLDEALGKPA